MDTEGPQSGGMQSADLMDFMDGDDELQDTLDTSNDGAGDTAAGSEQSDTPLAQDPSHPREDDAVDDESDDALAAATPQGTEGANVAPSWEPTTPFTYQVGHATHSLGDAQVGADGVLYVPKENVEEVQRLISRGRYHEEVYPRERQQLERRAREAESRYDENAIKAKASAEFFDKLSQQPPEQILQFLTNWQTNRPQVLAAQERAQAQELYKRAQAIQAGDPAENAYRQQEQKAQTIQSIAANVGSQYAFLTPEDRKVFAKRLERNQGQLFLTADRDYASHETSNGIAVQKGSLALNQQYLNEELSEFAAMRAQANAQAQQSTKNVAFNQRQQPRGRVAPQSGARTSNATPRDARSGQFTNGKQWRDSMLEEMGIASATNQTG